MNVNLGKALVKSKIADEVIAAVEVIATNRAAPTPAVLIPFVGYVEPLVAVTDTVRNTAILAMLSHLILVPQPDPQS